MKNTTKHWDAKEKKKEKERRENKWIDPRSDKFVQEGSVYMFHLEVAVYFSKPI